MRRYFESRFTAAHMATNYVAAYEAMIAKSLRELHPCLHVVSASADLVAAE